MDAELKVVRSHARLVEMALETRQKRLERTTERLSRHHNRIKHTKLLLVMVRELQEVVLKDPDLWDEEPVSQPF